MEVSMESRSNLEKKTKVLRHYFKKLLQKLDISCYQFSQDYVLNHVTLHRFLTARHQFLYPHNIDKLHKILIENKIMEKNTNWEKEFKKLKLIF